MTPPVYGCRDRTAEFIRLAAAFSRQIATTVGSDSGPQLSLLQGPSRPQHRGGPGPPCQVGTMEVPSLIGAARADAVTESAERRGSESFISLEEARLGQEIANLEQQIILLDKFVKQRGIFNDRSAEIQELTCDVRQRIVSLTNMLDNLSQALQGSTYSIDAQTLMHHRTVIETLRRRVAEIAAQVKRLMQLRAEILKSQDARRRLYSSDPNQSRRANRSDASFFDRDSSSVQIDTDASRTVEQQQLLFAPRESNYYSARAEAVESVQKTIVELAQIFNRVASLVSAQEELTVRVEDDMSTALHNVKEGEVQLVKYLTSIRNNRSLILKIFAILIVFVLFFVIFLS